MILLVTGKAATPGFAGLAIGLTLTAVHLIGIPLDRHVGEPGPLAGPALFAGGEPFAHVWLFILAPLVGAALAVFVVRALTVPLVTEEAARAAEAPTTGDRTGAELPADELPVQIPPPAEGRHDHRASSR